MNDREQGRLSALPTPLKILLIMSLALLPIGLATVWLTNRNLAEANAAIDNQARDKAQVTIETLRLMISRNALAIRVAANAVLPDQRPDPCGKVERILEVAPNEARQFDLLDDQGSRLCAVGGMDGAQPGRSLLPGEVAIWVPSEENALLVRSGVVSGAATVRIDGAQFVEALKPISSDVGEVSLIAGGHELVIRDVKQPGGRIIFTLPFSNKDLTAKIAVIRPTIDLGQRLLIFLPLIMWAAAAIISWAMVHRLLIRPLRRLQGAVSAYEPGDPADMVVPPGLGPATEIHELGEAFQRAVIRVEGAEREAREALDGQRRLVREVHHRVKNNLQVVASLLSIHGRNATDDMAQSAYAAIGRRVDALAVVHRNHYAELEENRGIILRPLVTELAAGLRASAPSDARQTIFELEIDNVATTQDAAVATSFLITEIVEFAMLRIPDEPVRIAIRRTSELTANLSIESAVLIPDTVEGDQPKLQFERIVEGLARQLRSPLDRRLGRYSVTLPVFPQD